MLNGFCMMATQLMIVARVKVLYFFEKLNKPVSNMLFEVLDYGKLHRICLELFLYDETFMHQINLTK